MVRKNYRLFSRNPAARPMIMPSIATPTAAEVLSLVMVVVSVVTRVMVVVVGFSTVVVFTAVVVSVTV